MLAYMGQSGGATGPAVNAASGPARTGDARIGEGVGTGIATALAYKKQRSEVNLINQQAKKTIADRKVSQTTEGKIAKMLPYEINLLRENAYQATSAAGNQRAQSALSRVIHRLEMNKVPGSNIEAEIDRSGKGITPRMLNRWIRGANSAVGAARLWK